MYDQSKLADSHLMVAYSCISAGLFLEAKDLLQSIDSVSLDTERKVGIVFHLFQTLFRYGISYSA